MPWSSGSHRCLTCHTLCLSRTPAQLRSALDMVHRKPAQAPHTAVCACTLVNGAVQRHDGASPHVVKTCVRSFTCIAGTCVPIAPSTFAKQEAVCGMYHLQLLSTGMRTANMHTRSSGSQYFCPFQPKDSRSTFLAVSASSPTSSCSLLWQASHRSCSSADNCSAGSAAAAALHTMHKSRCLWVVIGRRRLRLWLTSRVVCKVRGAGIAVRLPGAAAGMVTTRVQLTAPSMHVAKLLSVGTATTSW